MAAFMSTRRPMKRFRAARKTSCKRNERRMKASGRGRRHPAPARELVLPTIMRTRRRDATGVHPEGDRGFFPEGLLRKSAALRDFNALHVGCGVRVGPPTISAARPLLPSQADIAGSDLMSQKCHYRTHAPQQTYKNSWPVLQGPTTIAKLAKTALLSSEAVEEPVPAGTAEIALAAAAIGPARGMR